MRILKWCLVFVIAFAAAWILIFTFTQEPFKVPASVNIFGYQSAKFPIYVFAASAFGIGLLIGFIAAGYYYFSGQAGIRSKKKEIKKLTETISVIEAERDQYRTEAQRGKGPQNESK